MQSRDQTFEDEPSAATATGGSSSPFSYPMAQNCPVCRASNLRDRWKVNGFVVTECKGCTFVFVRDLIPANELSKYYEGSGDPAYIDDDNLPNLNFYYERLRALIEKRLTSGKILDVGCSSGHFLDVMEGWDRYGVEISPNYHLAKQKYGEHISNEILHKGQWDPGFFDVITLLDSFDHMLEPMEVLSMCRSFLRPGGLIVVKVHDISSLFARVTGKQYYALGPPYHMSYFSPRTLKLALEKNNFSLLENKYVPHILFLRTIFYRLSQEGQKDLFGKIYHALEGTALGRIKVKKNVFDIMTMLATAD